MSNNHPPTAQFQAALKRISELDHEFVHAGVSERNARRTLLEDTCSRGNRFFLRAHAYRPTGVALGCPLPDAALQSCLAELANRAEECLQRLCCTAAPVFARVPPVAYHITLVNRTHFDLEQDRRKVHALSPSEKEQVDRVFRSQKCGVVTVRYQGIVATASGRLMVPAYPQDGNIFQLKEALRDGILGGRLHRPVMGSNYPPHMITKLGHILVPLQGPRLAAFLEWIHEEAAAIDRLVSFADAYTQRGRVRL